MEHEPALRVMRTGGEIMNYFLLRNLPEQVTKEDLENACAKFGPVEYVRIQPTSSSGRVAVVKMAKVEREKDVAKEPRKREFRERRLRLVKPRPKKAKGEEEKPVPNKSSESRIMKALEYLLRSLKVLKSLPEKVKVNK
ncbi:MAG: RNA-binding protein [Desulfobacteraceae bacterium]|nr:MAG: RNA-binding protein [Desulfobacteraceae bacterium]